MICGFRMSIPISLPCILSGKRRADQCLRAVLRRPWWNGLCWICLQWDVHPSGGRIFCGLADACVRPDSNGDDRVGGIVDFNDGAQQLKLFTLH